MCICIFVDDYPGLRREGGSLVRYREEIDRQIDRETDRQIDR